METNFDVFDKNGSGVYMIKNVLNNHKYIGSTKNFKQRLKQHKDKNGNIVNIYNSTTEAADFLLEHELMNKNRKIVSCAISACARGVNKKAYKYIWEYGN